MSNEVDELKERIEELKQTVDGHNVELVCREDVGYDKAMLEMENKIEHSFNAGFDCGFYAVTDAEKLKALLNYNMEQRL